MYDRPYVIDNFYDLVFEDDEKDHECTCRRK